MDRGSKIWVEDEQLAWVAAEVVDIQNQHVRARTEKGKTMVMFRFLAKNVCGPYLKMYSNFFAGRCTNF